MIVLLFEKEEARGVEEFLEAIEGKPPVPSLRNRSTGVCIQSATRSTRTENGAGAEGRTERRRISCVPLAGRRHLVGRVELAEEESENADTRRSA